MTLRHYWLMANYYGTAQALAQPRKEVFQWYIWVTKAEEALIFFILIQTLRCLNVCWRMLNEVKGWNYTLIEWWEPRSWRSRHNLSDFFFFFKLQQTQTVTERNITIFMENLLWPKMLIALREITRMIIQKHLFSSTPQKLKLRRN